MRQPFACPVFTRLTNSRTSAIWFLRLSTEPTHKILRDSITFLTASSSVTRSSSQTSAGNKVGDILGKYAASTPSCSAKKHDKTLTDQSENRTQRSERKTVL